MRSETDLTEFRKLGFDVAEKLFETIEIQALFGISHCYEGGLSNDRGSNSELY